MQARPLRINEDDVVRGDLSRVTAQLDAVLLHHHVVVHPDHVIFFLFRDHRKLVKSATIKKRNQIRAQTFFSSFFYLPQIIVEVYRCKGVDHHVMEELQLQAFPPKDDVLGEDDV